MWDPDEPGSLAEGTASAAASREMATADLVDQREMVRSALADLPRSSAWPSSSPTTAGFTQAQIAERLSTPLGTVKTRMRLGMRKMRVALEGRVGEMDPPADPAGRSSAHGRGGAIPGSGP